MSQRMGGCAAAWQAVRGAPESREHVVTGTGVVVGGGGGSVEAVGVGGWGVGVGKEVRGYRGEIPGSSPPCATGLAK